MSTNNSIQLDELDLTGASQALAAGFPDPNVLTGIANKLFQGLPDTPLGNLTGGQLSQTPDVSLGGVFPQLEGYANPANATIPESDLQAVANDANSLFNSSQTIQPDIQEGASLLNFSVIPSFSFIEEARPLFGATTTAIPAQEFASTVKNPTETTLRNAVPTLPGAVPASASTVPVPTDAIATPQIPGAVVRTGDKGKPGAFSFIEASRSISSINVVPTLAPVEGVSNGIVPQADLSAGLFDVNAIRRDFPILQETVNGRPLVWLDNAATTQKPQQVIDRLSYFYQHENSNVHRAAHELAARSTDAYDAARENVRHFLNAGSVKEIVFVRGATEAINLVAKSWGDQHIQEGDEIIVSHLEHHANIVPWQQLCAVKGARLRVAPVDNDGQILLDEYEKLFNTKTRLVAFAQVSNALGTITPVQEMVSIAHRYGAKVLVDGAQAVSHISVDVQAYDCDFYVFSGHKVFGPTGIGVVYGKEEILNTTQPWQGGGNMIVDVTFEKTIYHPAPFRFEAGTGNIADAVGLGAAIDYVERIGMANIAHYEHDLLLYAIDGLKKIPGLHLIGTAREKASVLSFVLDGFTNDQVGQALNKEGIAVRTGHHCAQPILRRFGQESTVRPSLAFYNTCEEIDLLVSTVWNLKNGRTQGLI